MIKGIDHFNLSTSDMAATCAFFEDMFGLRAQAAPGQDAARNSWIYDDAGRALVHVNLREHAGADGPIQHVAFACEGYDAMRDRLVKAGHTLREMDNRAVSGVRQMFLRSPEGAMIELNFSGD